MEIRLAILPLAVLLGATACAGGDTALPTTGNAAHTSEPTTAPTLSRTVTTSTGSSGTATKSTASTASTPMTSTATANSSSSSSSTHSTSSGGSTSVTSPQTLDIKHTYTLDVGCSDFLDLCIVPSEADKVVEYTIPQNYRKSAIVFSMNPNGPDADGSVTWETGDPTDGSVHIHAHAGPLSKVHIEVTGVTAVP